MRRRNERHAKRVPATAWPDSWDGRDVVTRDWPDSWDDRNGERRDWPDS